MIEFVMGINNGEKAELVYKAKLLRAKFNDEEIPPFGKITSLSDDANLSSLVWKKECEKFLKFDEAKKLQKCLGLKKAGKYSKADVTINGINYSFKDLSGNDPALLNHFLRPTYEAVCKAVSLNIDELDNIIEEYWKLRENKIIGEDTHIQQEKCPFKNHEDYLKPIILYLAFEGQEEPSDYPAEKMIITMLKTDPDFIEIYDKEDYWEHAKTRIKFALRGHRLAKGWKDENKESKEKWMRMCNGKLKGQLHIRYSPNPPKYEGKKRGC